MTYPKTLSEIGTINAALRGENLARFGDGELRLAMGGKAISQKADPELAKELRQILKGDTKSFPCIPSYSLKESPRSKFWDQYYKSPTLDLYDLGAGYGSSWVTRADSAPWLDTPEYWDKVRELWKDKNVLFVGHEDEKLIAEMEKTSRDVHHLQTPKSDAYQNIDDYENICQEWWGFSGDEIIIMSCGATATVLAHRLAAQGIHAVDIGHMSMFMSVAGAYEFSLDDLASPYYRDQLGEAHTVKKWGTGGYSHVPMAAKFARELEASSILDYGSGRGTFKTEWRKQGLPGGVIEFDPGFPDKAVIPKPADMVVCTDVLEHVEPEKLDAVLTHIFRIGRKGAYLVIATKASNKVLPDGRNSHLIQKGLDYWQSKIETLGYTDCVFDDGRKHITVWCTK